MKYFRKPIIIEAYHIDEDQYFWLLEDDDNMQNLPPDWIYAAIEEGDIFIVDGEIVVVTKDTEKTADIDNYIILYPNNTLDVLTAAEFEEMYEEVN